MEADVPSELDITDNSSGNRSSTEHTTELDNTLVSQRHTFGSGKCELVPRILQVLRVRIVERRNFSLSVTIPLHGISDIVSLCWEQGYGRHARGESTCEVSCAELVTGIEGHLSFHTHDFVAGVEVSKGDKLGLGS